MRSPTAILLASLLSVSGGVSLGQDAPFPAVVLQSEVDEQRALLERVIANQKRNDLAQFTYERLERLEIPALPGGGGSTTRPSNLLIAGRAALRAPGDAGFSLQ